MKEQIMKTMKHLLVAAAAVLTVNVASAAPLSTVQSPKNTALLASPRYLEAHPELLRVTSAQQESTTAKTDRLAKLANNTALANSPRFREAHPELRWSSSPNEQLAIQNFSRSAERNALTSNKALASSPRFREQHPELLREQPVFEIAPLK